MERFDKTNVDEILKKEEKMVLNKELKKVLKLVQRRSRLILLKIC